MALQQHTSLFADHEAQLLGVAGVLVWHHSARFLRLEPLDNRVQLVSQRLHFLHQGLVLALLLAQLQPQEGGAEHHGLQAARHELAHPFAEPNARHGCTTRGSGSTDTGTATAGQHLAGARASL